MMRSARYFIYLIPCILSSLAASLPAINVANITLPSTNLSSTSLGGPHHRLIPVPNSEVSLYIQYFDDARIPRPLLECVFNPARIQAVDLVAAYGKDTIMPTRYKWGFPGCWFYVDNYSQGLTKRMTYGILKETVEILWIEMFARADIPFVLYVDILEGNGRAEMRIGTAVVAKKKPGNWYVTSDTIASNVTTS
jgi:hypothetical protein